MNIGTIHSCYGCGVCAAICPQGIVEITLDNNGFYKPGMVDSTKCTQCGLCFSVCAYSHADLETASNGKIDGYAAWSQNEAVRYSCSSGGVSFEIAKYLIAQGYKTCGVKYNAEQCRAEHFIANKEQDYRASMGSKYLQSYTLNAFTSFNKNDKYFVTGTPCQIDSLRRYIKITNMEKNFILLDFFCHGVPSMLMWKKYIKSVERKIGVVSDVSWRSKANGWHDSYAISATGKNTKTEYFSLRSKGDLFYRMFLGDICLGKACYDSCKYKALSSSADIRIGDLWGNTYKKDDKGISGVLVLTEKGKQVVSSLGKNVIFKPENLSVVIDGQMKNAPQKNIIHFVCLLLLKTNLSLNAILVISRLISKMVRSVNASKRKIHKIKWLSSNTQKDSVK